MAMERQWDAPLPPLSLRASTHFHHTDLAPSFSVPVCNSDLTGGRSGEQCSPPTPLHHPVPILNHAGSLHEHRLMDGSKDEDGAELISISITYYVNLESACLIKLWVWPLLNRWLKLDLDTPKNAFQENT